MRAKKRMHDLALAARVKAYLIEKNAFDVSVLSESGNILIYVKKGR